MQMAWALSLPRRKLRLLLPPAVVTGIREGHSYIVRTDTRPFPTPCQMASPNRKVERARVLWFDSSKAQNGFSFRTCLALLVFRIPIQSKPRSSDKRGQVGDFDVEITNVDVPRNLR